MEYWVHLDKVKEDCLTKALAMLMTGRRNKKAPSPEEVVEVARKFEKYIAEDALYCAGDKDFNP